MKRTLCILSIGFVLGIPFFASAQVTNLKIENVSSNFSMTSGDTFSWEYNCPTGATVTGEIWYDVNSNGIIDAGDVLRFAFTQTDGNNNPNSYGPPDEDGSLNGHVLFYQRLGVAPGKYVFRFTQNGSSVTEAGTVLALASPAHTISGHVTPPSGKSAENINVELHRHNGNGGNSAGLDFWDGYTNSSGDFQIAMDADTSGNPWDFQIQNNPYPPSILTPGDTSITIIGNPSGINLALQPANAQVAGYYKDDSGNPIQNDVFVQFNGSIGFNAYFVRDVPSDLNGLFQIGFLSSELSEQGGQHWTLSTYTNGDSITTSVIPSITLPVIHNGDSLFYNFVAYTVNSTITGKVEFNGGPISAPYEVQAINPDTGYSFGWTDNQGNFVLKVSNKISNYNLTIYGGLGPDLIANTVVVHPGETGAMLNITTTSVRDASAKVPAVFALSQNYPNPFNPTTEIQFTVPSDGRAVLKVFNVLGQEVATLFDGEAAAGKIHEVQFNGSNLASGVYFSRLEFGGKVQMKKMILLK